MRMNSGVARTGTAIALTTNPICLFPFTFRLANTGNTRLIRRNQKGVFLCSVLSTQNDSIPHGVESSSSNNNSNNWIRRRAAMLHMAFSALILQTSPALSSSSDDSPEFRLFSDEDNKYQIFIPQDWKVGAGQTDGIKSITAFYPDEVGSASNVSVLITGLGPDFTRLESFGKVDAFAENLVSGLDRSWQRPPGVAAKLIDCKSANGLYYIEYTLQNPGESQRHIYSVLGMANNGWYNRLYTVTGQFVEEETDKYGTKIEKAVQSFRLR